MRALVAVTDPDPDGANNATWNEPVRLADGFGCQDTRCVCRRAWIGTLTGGFATLAQVAVLPDCFVPQVKTPQQMVDLAMVYGIGTLLRVAYRVGRDGVVRWSVQQWKGPG